VCVGNLVRQGTLQFILRPFGNDGSDLSIATDGNLSSSQIAFSSANDACRQKLSPFKSRSPLKK
jgi:hypothetical protein